MNPRTPLLLFAIALPFTGCTCEWHASTSKSWSTNSGGERVVVVQDNPDQIAREREARIAREREWERERERERARRPVVVNQGGRTGTGAGPHGAPTGQPSGQQPSVQPVPTPLQPGSFGSSGGVGAPVVQPSAPVVPATPVPPAPAPAPAPPVAVPTPPPPPPAGDTYVAPREINKPAGGPAGAATATDQPNNTNKKKAPQRSGRMTRQQ